MTAVQPGQVWAPLGIHLRYRVLRVDGAFVWTDQGRQTVFSLRRRYRLVQDTPATLGGAA